MMKSFSKAFALVALVALGAYCLPALADGETLTLMAMAAAAPVSSLPWLRTRETSFTFENVVATGKASGVIPRYARTLLRMQLQLGGTTFTKAMITWLKLKLGTKTVWETTGTNLQKINDYLGEASNDNFLLLDFTNPRDKVLDAEQLGGLDMTVLPAGDLILEVQITGATAPTLEAHCVWAPPQGNNVVKRLVEITGNFGNTGRNTVRNDLKGMDITRLYLMYAGTDFAASAVASAFSGNTGNGAMGAVTVTAGCKVGTHKIQIIEPAANAGTFQHFDPDGILVSAKGQVASAYAAGGLSFTLADGGTDFTAGDGFEIVVSKASNGNVSRAEVKKDSVPVFDRSCAAARFEQTGYGAKPQSRMFVTDFVVEKNSQGWLRTVDAEQIELNYWLTATDSYTLYAEGMVDANDL